MIPLQITGVVAGLVSALAVITAVLLVAYLVSRKKVPPSPDYKAIGDFQPATVFTWGSSSSITKSLQEEHHTVQPKYGLKSPVYCQSISEDEASIGGMTTASGTTTSSHSSLGVGVKDRRACYKDAISVYSKHERIRTLSEMSETSSGTSIDSSNYDAASIIGIKPELYTRKDTVLRQESSVATLGRLHIRIKYDFRTSDLIIHLIEAQDLTGFESTSGFHDPFVRLILESHVDSKTRQSSIKRQTKNPVFNEYFKWPVGFEDLKEKSLSFQIYDFDKYSHDELVGEVKVDFTTTDVSTTVELWCDIEPATNNAEGLGEVLVSLSYLPTAERLTTVIMKARNLKQPRASTKIDPIVRTTLVVEGKTIKRKRTTVRKATLNPVWNEAHVFKLSQNLLENATLEFAVADHELMGQGDIIGSCTVGKNRPGMEGVHWKEMSLNVRKAVAKWQVLKCQNNQD